MNENKSENSQSKRLIINRIKGNLESWNSIFTEIIQYTESEEKTFQDSEYIKQSRPLFLKNLTNLKEIISTLSPNGSIGLRMAKLNINNKSEQTKEIDELIFELKKLKNKIVESFANSYQDPQKFQLYHELEDIFKNFNHNDWHFDWNWLEDKIQYSKKYNSKNHIEKIKYMCYTALSERNIDYEDTEYGVVDYVEEEKLYLQRCKKLYNNKKNLHLDDFTKLVKIMSMYVGRLVQYSITRKIQLLAIYKVYSTNLINIEIFNAFFRINKNKIKDIIKDLLNDFNKTLNSTKKIQETYLNPNNEKTLIDIYEKIKKLSPKFYNKQKENFQLICNLIQKNKKYFLSNESSTDDMKLKSIHDVIAEINKNLRTFPTEKMFSFDDFNTKLENIENLFQILDNLDASFGKITKIFAKFINEFNEERKNNQIDSKPDEYWNFFYELKTLFLKFSNNVEYSTIIEDQNKRYYIFVLITLWQQTYPINKLAIIMDHFLLKIASENFNNIDIEDLKFDKKDTFLDFQLSESKIEEVNCCNCCECDECVEW